MDLGSVQLERGPRRAGQQAVAAIDAAGGERRQAAGHLLFSGAPRADPAVGEGAEGFGRPDAETTLGQGEDPSRIPVDRRHPASPTPVQLPVEQQQELGRPPAHMYDSGGNAFGLHPHRHDRCPSQTVDHHEGIAARNAAQGAQLVAYHEDQLTGDPLLGQPGGRPVGRVGLVRQPDLYVFDVGRDPGFGQSGTSSGSGGDLGHLGQTVDLGGAEATGYRLDQLTDAGLRRIGPRRFGDEVDLPPVEPSRNHLGV